MKQFSKQEIVQKSIDFWNPHRTRFWQSRGIDLVIGKREGYYLHDMDGRRFLDCHLNGGTYSFGHRNPELLDVLREGLDETDAGNHHFPSYQRALLAEKLARMTPGELRYSVFTCSGSEAVDVAIKSARNVTGKTRIVSVEKCFHGHTGYALSTGDDRFLDLFKAGQDEQFVKIPFNDLDALEDVLSSGDVAAFILETIPATYGFKMPEPGYLEGVRRLTEKHGALWIADEVQTGLLRSGHTWALEAYNLEPDMLITGKCFGGGLYPIAATVISERYAGWLKQDGFGHVSTYGGAEVGCYVASRVLDICEREAVRNNVKDVSTSLRNGLDSLMQKYPDTFTGIRQQGLIIGLEFNHPTGGITVMQELFKNSVWAIFASFDESVLQFKPGVFWDDELCNEFLSRMDVSLDSASEIMRNDPDFDIIGLTTTQKAG